MLDFLTLRVPASLAQATGSSVLAGQALVARDGKPMPFTLVTLSGAAAGYALTDREGRFEFREVPPGDYRLRLEQVGREPDSDVPIHFVGGQRAELTVRDSARPLVLPRADTSGGVCYPGSLLHRQAVLSVLWRELEKAARARRALDLSYSYRVSLNEELARYSNYTLSWPRRQRRTLESTPEGARSLAARGSFAGYGVGMDSTRLVAISEMLEVLDDDYLRWNCLVALPAAEDEWRVRFQPLNPERERTQLIGNIVLDRSFTLRRIEFEYRRQGKAVARGFVRYGDGGLPGGQLRFVDQVRVEMMNAPQTEGVEIELGPRGALEQRGMVYVGYGRFVRDTTDGAP